MFKRWTRLLIGSGSEVVVLIPSEPRSENNS